MVGGIGGAIRTSTSDIVTQSIDRSSRNSRFLKGSAIPKPTNLNAEGLAGILWHPLSLLLLLTPFGIAAHFCEWGSLLIFWLNFFAMIPMAKIMGDATEELAAGLRNDMLAGLLNATFGNAVEMVIMIQTLRKGLFDVVKATLLGSVLSNMLLVLGMSFFFGGIVNHRKNHKVLKETIDTPGSGGIASNRMTMSSTMMAMEKVQHFPVLSALVNTSMLLLSCLSFSLVTVFNTVTRVDKEKQAYMDEVLLPVSRICSCIVGSSYVAYIIFQLITHKGAMSEDDDDDGAVTEAGDAEDEPQLSVRMSTTLLFVTTAVVAVCSELVVETIENVCEQAHLSMHFIGIILLPIVGNACEHVSAVRFAMKDKPGLAIGIAIGSSTQIALFVVPMSVLFGWCLDKDMDLNFGALNTTVMTLSVVVVLSMIVDGQSNWLSGYLLMAAYAVVAVLYFHLPNDLPNVE